MAGEQLLYNRPLPGARVNMSHPLSKGLVGCWLLNENGGIRAMDASPYQNDGLLGGFADPPPRSFNGLKFDGSNDAIDCDSKASLYLGGDLTFEFWIKSDDLTVTSRVLGYGSDQSALGVSYNVGWGTGIRVNAWFQVGDATSNELVGFALDTWYHFAISRLGTLLSIYWNGQLFQTLTQANAWSSSLQNTYIGKRNATGTEFWKGSIGLVRIYNNRVLSLDDVKALYLSPYKPLGIPMFL